MCYTGGFYFDLPKDKSREDFGLNNPTEYSSSEFKSDVLSALIDHFGKDNVQRKDKCITILGNSYRITTDVVPTWEHKRFNNDGTYIVGTQFRSDKGDWIKNYPKQHIENGKKKNGNTQRRFKKLTRLFRKMRYKMIDDNEYSNDNITSFLLECLVWNVPDYIFNSNDTWNDRLKNSIIFLYDKTKEGNKSCEEWGEVSDLLYLFHNGRKWSKVDVNYFLKNLWNYLEYNK